ncbi:hypothetical protein JB92DRAFT_3196120 [Gautieria morchelliformis]|nr:hypothetical protein JB92DRAFT_3196120 [Gautieria morchelliformis]
MCAVGDPFIRQALSLQGLQNSCLTGYVETQHHHKWYISDGSAIFQVENKLYKVHAALLANISVTLQEMFAMPSGTEHSCEGTRDDRPIVLHPPVTSQKLDYFLEWFYSQMSQTEVAVSDTTPRTSAQTMLYPSIQQSYEDSRLDL